MSMFHVLSSGQLLNAWKRMFRLRLANGSGNLPNMIGNGLSTRNQGWHRHGDFVETAAIRGFADEIASGEVIDQFFEGEMVRNKDGGEFVADIVSLIVNVHASPFIQ